MNAEDNIPFSLTRTKSSGSVASQGKSPSALLKSKSSTFISPDQCEALMYNTKVTLTLRRSNSRLNSSVGDLNSPPESHNGHLNGIQPLRINYRKKLYLNAERFNKIFAAYGQVNNTNVQHTENNITLESNSCVEIGKAFD